MDPSPHENIYPKVPDPTRQRWYHCRRSPTPMGELPTGVWRARWAELLLFLKYKGMQKVEWYIHTYKYEYIYIFKHQYSIDEFVARGHIFVSSLFLFVTCDSSKSLKRVVFFLKIRRELLNLVLIRIGVSESLTFLGQQLMLWWHMYKMTVIVVNQWQLLMALDSSHAQLAWNGTGQTNIQSYQVQTANGKACTESWLIKSSTTQPKADNLKPNLNPKSKKNYNPFLSPTSIIIFIFMEDIFKNHHRLHGGNMWHLIVKNTLWHFRPVQGRHITITSVMKMVRIQWGQWCFFWNSYAGAMIIHIIEGGIYTLYNPQQQVGFAGFWFTRQVDQVNCLST